MIAIVNMGPHDPKAPMGWRTYEARINRDVIARFRHKRSDGLGITPVSEDADWGHPLAPTYYRKENGKAHTPDTNGF